MTAGTAPRHGQEARRTFSDAPLRVYWELTRACDLACRHCRAEAISTRDPNELTTPEGRALLEALASFGRPAPHTVLTGGDPLKRPDFWELLAHGASVGLDLSVAPSGTSAITPEVIHRFKAAGVQAMSLSLDGSNPERHDGFRMVPGCFARTVEAAHTAVRAGLPLQINSLVTAETRHDLPAIADLVERIGVQRWSLFFLIQVGRGRDLGQLTAEECERLLEWLWERGRRSSVVFTTTEAPHYRRVALQALKRLPPGEAETQRAGLRRGFGIRDGNGIMFVSHTGEVSPSGFLPLVAGSVRTSNVVDIYRSSPMFVELRQAERFGGRCGRCEFKEICGGSRARAWATMGSLLAEDPLCPYEPGHAV